MKFNGKSGIISSHWQPLSGEQKKKFKDALAEQERLKKQQTEAPGGRRFNIHDDARWRGPRAYDKGLRGYINGRSHWKRVMKGRGLVDCGDAKAEDFK